MSVYHQMGHDSKNLVLDKKLESFAGMVCSPINYEEDKVAEHIKALPEGFDAILDPQLYFPKSQRGKLQCWKHFPTDFESADITSIAWWKSICDELIKTSIRINCTHICSPCQIASKFNSAYYKFYVDIGNYLFALAKKNNKGYYQTAIIDFNSIKDIGEVETITSILSQTKGDQIYLILKTDVPPRQELSDSDSIASVMKLIRLLTKAGLKVFVGFCSSEFILWKYSGATKFASGKFFNLRRFTSSRFDEPSNGGGQIPYWFERSLLSYLREPDIMRLNKANMLDSDYVNNPFSVEIFNNLNSNAGKSWLADSWRSYLYNFAELEKISNDEINNLFIKAENKWGTLCDKNILMEEQRNNGNWIRAWRIALNSFNEENL